MAQVLLIEPDRVLADLYRGSLESAGHEVLMCASAQSAIFAADAVKPDIVLLEVQLINHSGIEFLYEFRSYPEWSKVPVIIISNVPPAEFAGSSEILKSELGVDAYYYKPKLSLAELIKLVDQVPVTA